MRTNVLVGKMREHRAVLYTANGCVTQTRLRVCLVHNSMAFANQQGLYACVNVISIFHGKGPLVHVPLPLVTQESLLRTKRSICRKYEPELRPGPNFIRLLANFFAKQNMSGASAARMYKLVSV